MDEGGASGWGSGLEGEAARETQDRRQLPWQAALNTFKKNMVDMP